VSESTEWVGASSHRKSEIIMRMHKAWPQRPEIGSFALRMLWIPVIASLAIVGFLALHTPQDERASTMAVATAKAATSNVPTVSPDDLLSHLLYAAPVTSDEALAAHELLDPVGAGHDPSR
jgi:hypothetical protein